MIKLHNPYTTHPVSANNFVILGKFGPISEPPMRRWQLFYTVGLHRVSGIGSVKMALSTAGEFYTKKN